MMQAQLKPRNTGRLVRIVAWLGLISMGSVLMLDVAMIVLNQKVENFLLYAIVRHLPILPYAILLSVSLKFVGELERSPNVSQMLPTLSRLLGLTLIAAAAIQIVAVPNLFRFVGEGLGGYLAYDPGYLGAFVIGCVLLAMRPVLQMHLDAQEELKHML